MSSLQRDGFEILRGVFSPEELSAFRTEASRVSAVAGSTSVRLLSEYSEEFRELSGSDRMRRLVGKEQRMVRSILFDKTAEQNWPVLWHQDLTIAVQKKEEVCGYLAWSSKDGVPHVQPPLELLLQMVTARIHLDPTPASNGALKVIPGSHQRGKISQESIRQVMDDSEEEVVCECEAGDVLLMSPLILHSSGRSQHPSRRRVLHFEYATPGLLAANLIWREGCGAAV